jgi:hypothetical protein
MSKKSRPDSGPDISRKEREKRMKSAFYAAAKYHEDLGVPFYVDYTHGRRTIVSKLMKETFNNGRITKKGMNFIKTVKHKMIKEGVPEKVKRKSREELGLQYLFFNKKFLGQTLTNVIELDLSNAYWDAAYKMNAISKEDYYKGLGLPKVERLAALGSTARTLKRRTFDGKKWSKAVVLDNSEATRHIWFAISNRIDKVMKSCARELKDQLVFYWIDALFFINTKKNRDLVQSIIKKAGYQSKFVKIIKVELGQDRAKAWSKEKGEYLDKETGIPMRFFAYHIENSDLFKIWKKKKNVPINK